MLLTVLCCVYSVHGIQIMCDSDECFDQPCCLITDTPINTTNFFIAGLKDDTVRLLDLSRNRNIKFLPICVGYKFPNMVFYEAERCTIKEISKFNFQNLFHLRKLNLIGNMLATIQSDTFYDLVSLRTLLLGKSCLKFDL